MKRLIWIFAAMLLATAAVMPLKAGAAVIVTPSPSPATVGQPVTVTVVSEFLAGAIPPCSVPVNFGDGSPQVITTTSPLSCVPVGANVNCTTSATHTYAAPGTFTITANDSACGLPAVPIPPTAGSAALTVASPAVASVTATPSPAFLAVPAGEDAGRAITYSFTSNTPGVTLNSSGGAFTAGSMALGSVPTPLAVTVNGRGAVTEMLTIPVSVLEQALQAGQNRITYARTFVNAGLGISVPVSVTVAVTGEGAADFAIKRIALSFDRRGTVEKTVPRGEPGLRAWAEIRFVGTGVLQGFWEVDGRILSQVAQQLVQGGNALLVTPPAPPLPTFDPGTHVIRFVIQSPAVTFDMPAIAYTVLPDAETAVIEPLTLSQPEDNALLDYEPPTFHWRRLSVPGTYEVRFFREQGDEVIFSAFTADASYTVPRALFRSLFTPGATYRWQVRLIRDEKPAAESRQARFRFRELRGHVPGQVVVIRGNGEANGEDLARRFGLRIVEIFPLPSVGLTGMLLQADDNADVVSLAGKLQNEAGVVMAQPNFLLRLLEAVSGKVGHAGDLLRLDRLRKTGRGTGVRIAVVDTGVDERHRNLKRRIGRTANFVRGETYRGEIHGTAVAGIIAAEQDGSGMEGVAPGAEIVALRACRQSREDAPEGECTSDSLAKALDDAITRRADLVNMSFGKRETDPLLAKVLDAGMEKGVVFVAPAGNGAGDSLLFPAAYPGVVSVAGLDDKGRPYPSAALAGKATVSAPAVGIFTTVPGDRHNFLSGTSFSSAYVTGLLALAREKYGTVGRDKLPQWRGNLCEWEEELLKVSLCGK